MKLGTLIKVLNPNEYLIEIIDNKNIRLFFGFLNEMTKNEYKILRSLTVLAVNPFSEEINSDGDSAVMLQIRTEDYVNA